MKTNFVVFVLLALVNSACVYADKERVFAVGAKADKLQHKNSGFSATTLDTSSSFNAGVGAVQTVSVVDKVAPIAGKAFGDTLKTAETLVK